MYVQIKEIVDKNEKEFISRQVLYDIPEWFGLPESTENYIKNSKDMPFLACYVNDEVAGLIVLNATSNDSAEIYVMGLKKEFHKIGIGTRLNNAFETMAKKLGYTYLQVKTVKMGCYENYDITNKFYIAMGYKELECFPTLWDEHNPCQIYIKYINK